LSTFSACGPFVYPGDRISTAVNSCSIGLTGAIGPNRYVLTAGHCYVPGAPVADLNGRPVGWYETARRDPPDRSLLDPNTPYGYALIHLYTGLAGSPRSDGADLTTVDLHPVAGEAICKVGETTGRTCGHISSVTRTHIIANDLWNDHGDSGGVVYRAVGAGRGAFVGIIYGVSLANHAAVIVPAGYLLSMIQADRGMPFLADLTP
jgi:hypothetical protein